MAKKNVTIKFDAETKEAESGIKKLANQLQKSAKSMKSNDVTALATGFMAVTKAASLGVNAVKKVNEAIKETTELAAKQIKAEVQLQAAAKNNPYLTDASVIQLKNYASQLQSISTIGDEELLPMMSELAAAGRTQTEIQDIMQAALDLSASGLMSMDTAVSALNGTLQGVTGTLGKQIKGIKDLTKEELKNGEAIKIIKEQYAGMSEEVTKQIGGWQQYKNSLGDFKEVLGTGWANLQNSVGSVLSNFFDNITSKMKVAKQKAEEFKAELNLIAQNDDQGTKDTIQSEIDLLTKQNEQYEKYKEVLTTSQSDFVKGEKEKQAQLQKTYNSLQREMDEYVEKNQDMTLGAAELMANAEYLKEEFIKLHPEMVQVEKDLASQNVKVKNASKEWKTLNAEAYQMGYTSSVLDKRIKSNKDRIAELTPKLEEATQAAAALSAEEEAQAAIDARDKIRAEYDETIEKKKEEIRLRKQAGEEITKEREAQELFNTAVQAYVKMMSSPEFKGNSGGYSHEVMARAQIKEWGAQAKANVEIIEQVEQATEEEKENIWAHYEEIVGAWQTEEKESLNAQRTMLDVYASYLDQKSELTEEEIAMRQKLADAQKNIDAEILKQQQAAQQAQIEHIAAITSDISSYVQQFADITGQITDLARQNNEEQTQEELTELSKQYTDGLISYEEYCEKKKEIDRKAAKDEYKLKMWEWSASLIQATANIAEGVAKAIAQGGIAGIITGALVAASGAIQIAAITANKPKAPNFATGGIVPGTSYSGDRVQANVNSGEMILNAQQQAQLWKTANGGGAGGVINMPITIENNASDKVSASAQPSPDGLRVIINQIVSSEMEKGTYTQSMQIAQSRENGVTIL